jgi:hypothetical protein
VKGGEWTYFDGKTVGECHLDLLLAVLVDRGCAMKLIVICLLLTVYELRKKRLFVLDSPSLSDLVQ